jgi:hypothetical protein
MSIPKKVEVPAQKRLIDKREWDWILWFDGGRYDTFADMYDQYFEGELQAVWNGDYGYTGDWTEAHLSQNFDELGLFSPVPLRDFGATDYDGRDWFKVAPNYRDLSQDEVHKRLASLGYLEMDEDDEVWKSHTDRVNKGARQYFDEIEGGVIRYVKPHPPFEGLEILTSGSGKINRAKEALEEDEITPEELERAYEETYRLAFEGTLDIVPDLDGKVVITADHGECLYEEGCDQVFHARNLDPHKHLTVVPWFEVEEVKE